MKGRGRPGSICCGTHLISYILSYLFISMIPGLPGRPAGNFLTSKLQPPPPTTGSDSPRSTCNVITFRKTSWFTTRNQRQRGLFNQILGKRRLRWVFATGVTFVDPSVLKATPPAQDASVALSSVLHANSPSFSLGTMCTFPSVCFWPLMHATCVQSSLFSLFFCFFEMDSKDRVEVRVCLLAAFVRSRAIHSSSVKTVVMAFPQLIDLAMSRRCLCEITPEMAN